MPILADPSQAVERALRNPVGSKRLAEEARGKKTACILICDITRPVPNGLVLPPVVRELMAAGLKSEDIRIIIATGLHRPNLNEEMREVVGDDWVLETVKVSNHYARNEEDHLLVGETALGTEVLVDKRFVSADLRLAIGLVEPHFMAGYSGGRKIVMPGVCHERTIRRLHSVTYMEHPKADNCVLEGNPLHEEQVEIVRLLGGILGINTVIDQQRRLSLANFGDILEAHEAAVDFIRPYAEVSLPQSYRTVITSSAGYPLDRTYYQTVKGMVGAKEILAPGGDLFIVSEISEGMGSAQYVEAQKRFTELGADGFLREISQRRYARVDEWQTEMQLKPMRKGTVHLYTQGLSKEEQALTGITVSDDLTDFLTAIKESVGNGSRVAVLPEGPYVLPLLSSPERGRGQEREGTPDEEPRTCGG
jgi:nickel-dependent lactate racemase